MKKENLRTLMYILTLAILPVVFFWRNFYPFMEKVYFGNDSLISLYTLFSIAGQIKDGFVPLWDPHTFFGIPLLSRPDSLVFYPPLGFLALAGAFFKFGVERFFVLMELTTILHLSFAGISTYFVLRHFKLSNFASFIGGLIYMFNGNLIAFTNTTGLLISMTWLPLIFLTYDKLAKSPSLRNALLFSLAFAAPITTFAWQNAITYHLYFLGFYTIFLLWTKELTVNKRILYILFAFVLAIFVAAVVVFPGLEVTRISDRGALDYGLAAYGGNLKLRQLFDMVIPYIYAQNYGEGSTIILYHNTFPYTYAGIFTLLLIFPAFFVSANEEKSPPPYSIFFFAMFILFLLFALGGETPVYDFFYAVLFPLMKPFRNVTKIGYISFFSLSIVAAYGLHNLTQRFDELKERIYTYRKHLTTILLVLFTALFILITRLDGMIWHFIPSYYSEKIFSFSNAVIIFMLIFSFSVGAFYLIEGKYFKLAVFVILVFDLYMFAKNYPINNYGINPEKLIADNKVARFISSGNNYYERADLRGFSHSYAAGIRNLNHVDGYMVYRSKIVNKFLSLLTATLPERNLLADALAGIRYIPSWAETVGEGYKKVFENSVGSDSKDLYYIPGDSTVGSVAAPLGTKVRVFEKEERIPFVRLAKNIFILSDEEAGKKISAKEMDPFGDVIVSPETAVKVGDLGKGTVDFRYVKPYELLISADVDGPALVATGHPYYEDWRAQVNGKPQKIVRTNLAFFGVELPTGKSIIRIYYYPKIFYSGLVVSVASLFLTMGLLFVDIGFPRFFQGLFKRREVVA